MVLSDFSEFGIRQAILLLICGALISACQTDQRGFKSAGQYGQANQTEQLSLEESKQILAEFNRPDFQAPPRSSEDILDILEQGDALVEESNKQLIAEAREPIPAEATLHTHLTSYLSRARAARRLGWNGQELVDLRAAVAIVDRHNSGENVGFALAPSFEKVVIRDAAWAEISDGNFLTAIQLFSRAAGTVIPGAVPSNLNDIGRWKEQFGLALAHANAGDVAQARSIAKK